MKSPGQTAYEAYYLAIGGWATGHHWAMVCSDEQRAWAAVELDCRKLPTMTQAAEVARFLLSVPQGTDVVVRELTSEEVAYVERYPDRGLPGPLELSATKGET
jgi:hypothetical protein